MWSCDWSIDAAAAPAGDDVLMGTNFLPGEMPDHLLGGARSVPAASETVLPYNSLPKLANGFMILWGLG